MKFPTKVLTLSLVCMNMVTGALDSYLSSSDTNPPKCDTSMDMEPEDITTNSQNHDTNAMTPEDIQGLKEYEKLSEACEELNNLLDNGDIENFTEIPYKTATKVDSAIENLLKLILPKGSPEKDMYSAKYWIQKIIENPEDDYSTSPVKKILRRIEKYIDSINIGPCDRHAPDMLYSLAPYLNGDKISNIDARSVFGQMMLKLTTKEDLKKMALRMIFSSFFSGTRESDYFLTEYGLNTLPNTLHNHPKKDKYFSCCNDEKLGDFSCFNDEKLVDFMKKVKNHYLYICKNY